MTVPPLDRFWNRRSLLVWHNHLQQTRQFVSLNFLLFHDGEKGNC